MNDNKIVKCPWCGQEYPKNKISRHVITTCKKKPKNLTEVELVDAVVIAICGNVINDIIVDYENYFSLPDLKKKYGIHYDISKRLLTCHGIKLRSLSNSAKQITAKKIKETCSKIYGVDNPSKLEIIKSKKKDTFLKHYGIDNIWKTEEFKNFTRDRWNSYDENEKTRVLKGIIDKHRTGDSSKLEKKILCVLKDLGIDFEAQFRIGKYFHKYDAKIKGSNIILEINGDFWHANPKFFKENDILKFSKTNHPKAKDIWKKDEKNREFAEKNGYKVVYLWECEVKKKTEVEIGKILIDKLNE